ncbi:MAG: hypothetical protein ACHQ2Y_00380 [Candidatus Lutacidiplasmatales archaeon]
MSVGKYFRPGVSPFSVRAGPMRPETGAEDFVGYGSVLKLKDLVEKTFRDPISFRLVYGSYGAGKTWTFSWLWREFAQESGERRCFVIGVPRFEIRSRPERALVETILRDILETQPTLFKQAVSKGPAVASPDLRSLRSHFDSPDSRAVLAGITGASRVKHEGDARSFSLTKSDDLTRMLLATFEAIALLGYTRCLLLIDELDAPFLLGSRKDRIAFSEFLRGLYDLLSTRSEGDATYPHVEVLFSGTGELYEQFWPEALTHQLQAGTLMAAFIRRTEPPFLMTPPNESELEGIAKHHIGRARSRGGRDLGDWIPFDKAAIDLAWKKSGRNLGQFLHVASDMYRLAEGEKATRVTTEHCNKALAAYNEGPG